MKHFILFILKKEKNLDSSAKRSLTHYRSISTPTFKMALHFSGEAVEDQFYTDFGNLNKLQDEVMAANTIY